MRKFPRSSDQKPRGKPPPMTQSQNGTLISILRPTVLIVAYWAGLPLPHRSSRASASGEKNCSEASSPRRSSGRREGSAEGNPISVGIWHPVPWLLCSVHR
ncbi:hypothetical protein VPH35_022371 [Triticum aestivum]